MVSVSYTLKRLQPPDMARVSMSTCTCRIEQVYAPVRPRTHASQHPRLQQVAAAAGHAAGQPSMQFADSRHSSAIGPHAAHTQQQLSAASLLERPAAAPERLEASTSSTSTAAHASSARRRASSSSTRSTSSRAHAVILQLQSSSANGHRHVLQPELVASTAGATIAAEVDSISGMVHAISDDAVLDHPSSSRSNNGNFGGNVATGRLTPEGLQLMQDIMQQQSWQALADVIQQHARHCTAPHCAAALYKLAALWQQQEQYVLQQQPQMCAELRLQYPDVLKVSAVLLKALQQQIAAAAPRDLADALYALIRLGFRTQQQTMSDGVLGHTADHVSSSSGRGQLHAAATPAAEETAAVLPGVIPWGFCIAVLQQSHSLLLRGRFKAQQLSRILWGFAQLEVRPSGDWWAVALDAATDALQQRQQQQQWDSTHDHQQDHLHHHQPQQQQQEGFSPQGLAITGWAVAKLQSPASEAWWKCYMAAAAAAMPDMQPQHLSNCIWALATAQQTPDYNWMNGFFSASAKYLQHSDGCSHNNGPNRVQQGRSKHGGDLRFSPQGLANTLWALAVLQQQPPQLWQQQFEVAAAAELSDFSMQHLSMTLWAYGKLSSSSSSSSARQQRQQQWPSAAWLDQFWVQLSRVASDASAQSIACIVWGLVQIGAVIPDHRAHQLESLVCEVMRDATPQGLVVMVWGMGALRGQSTSRKLVKRVQQYCLNNQQQLATQLTPQGCVMLLSGLTRFKAWQPDALKQQLLTAVMQRVQLGTVSSSSSSGVSRAEFKACELPVVLLSLVQLRIALPTALLETAEAILLQQQETLPPTHQGIQPQQQQQLEGLTPGQLSVCLYALGLAKHYPSKRLLAAATAAVQARVHSMGYRDVAFVLCGLAAMGRVSGPQRQQQQEVLQQLVERADQVLDACDHSCVAMIMWSLAALQLHPSEAFLQHCLAVTTAQLPNMTLLSVTTILTSLKTMQYLPPVHWMIETCKAARSKVNVDTTAKRGQRRACVRRLEEAVAWFNEVLVQQQQQQQHGLSDRDGDPAQSVGVRGVQRRLSDAVLKGAAGVLGSGNTSSEAVIAAAVGVAAAVAQQWRW